MGPLKSLATHFDIPATEAVAGRGRRVLKRGDSFVVLDDFGQAQASGPAAEGLFFEDTRYLSRLALTVNRRTPLLLSSTVVESNSMLSVDLANPELDDPTTPSIPASAIHLRCNLILGEDALFGSLALHNYAISAARLEVAIEVAADFVDVFEVRGIHRDRRGALFPIRKEAGSLLFSYRGLDGITRRTRAVFDSSPSITDQGRASWEKTLSPGENWNLQFEVHCERDGRRPHLVSRDRIRSEQYEWRVRRREGRAGISSSNKAFDGWLQCSRDDLDMLVTETSAGLYAYAGVPWFSTAFGRDGIITALECLWLDSELAAGTLRFLAAHQANTIDLKNDAEPGKILHETRLGEMAAVGEVPFGNYYGSIDSTPLFVILAAAHYSRTGDRDMAMSMWPHVEAAITWMSEYGDADHDGFIEYSRKSELGLDNQGWKDSVDSIFHADGRLAEPPIALVEVQAYAYAAYRGAASLAEALGHRDQANHLLVSAQQLKQRFESRFWLDDLGTYALALDGAKQPCRVIASNAGHALFCGIARPERAAQVCATLMGPRSFSGWGVRTVGEGQNRYNPMSYHDGSVWPHDNAIIALGLGRYGYKEAAIQILEGMFSAAQAFELKRLPELFCGFGKRADFGPVAYPLACAPQAWSAATVFALLNACLGISFVPERHLIRFDRPRLPKWLAEMHLTNLRLGSANVDLVLHHNGTDMTIDVVGRKDNVAIAIVS